jgi:plasmid replication initiation protein
MDEKEDKKELKKHSAIIQITNKISALQRKIYNGLMYFAKKQLQENENLVVFEIPVVEVKKLIAQEDYRKEINDKETKDNIGAFVDITVCFNLLEKDKKVWVKMALLAMVKIDIGIVRYQFPDEILKEIKMPNIYCLLDLQVINKLSSKYAIALYEIAKDYINREIPKMEVDIFRKLMGIENKYENNFGDVKKRVLEPAIEELEKKTELRVTYELITTGKKITHIKFYTTQVEKPVEASEEKEIKPTISETDFLTEIMPLLPEYEILTSKESAELKELTAKHGKEIIVSNIKYTNRQNYQNYFVYLKKAITEDYAEKDRKINEMKAEERKTYELKVKQEEAAAGQREMQRKQAIRIYQTLPDEERETIEAEAEKALETVEGIEVVKKIKIVYENMKLSKIVELVTAKYLNR